MPQPGFQTKSRNIGEWFAAVFLLLTTAGLLGGSLALAVSGLNGTADNEGEALGAAAFLLFLAGVCAPFAFILVRKVMPRRAKHLAVAVQQPKVRRGEDVVARLEVLNPGKITGQVDLSLRCTALYEVAISQNGSRTAQTREHTVHEQTFALNGSGPQEFRFGVPADGPFSYEGTTFSMVWRVVARDTQPRRTDRTLEEPVEVLP